MLVAAAVLVGMVGSIIHRAVEVVVADITAVAVEQHAIQLGMLNMVAVAVAGVVVLSL
jgi:hypothetical protein